MPVARHRIAARRSLPTSVTRPSLLVDGSDVTFRAFIQTLFSVAGRVELIRERVGALYGISGAQFTILMGTLHMQGTAGVSIGVLAEHLHLRATFVTTQTNKLRASGLINKRDNPHDRRGVLLSLSADGVALLDRMLPMVSQLNDRIFGDLTRAEFATMHAVNDRLLDSTDEALAIVDRLGKRARRESA